MASYIASYPVIEVDSPSLVMLLAVAEAGPDGLQKDAFDELMKSESLILPRIQDLVEGKLIYLENSKYRLLKRGRILAQFFMIYRKILREEEKGG